MLTPRKSHGTSTTLYIALTESSEEPGSLVLAFLEDDLKGSDLLGFASRNLDKSFPGGDALFPELNENLRSSVGRGFFYQGYSLQNQAPRRSLGW
jgi:hypothetical protein